MKYNRQSDLSGRSRRRSLKRYHKFSIFNLQYSSPACPGWGKTGSKLIMTETTRSRSFVIPVLDFSPHSSYNIKTLLDDLQQVSGEVICIFNSAEVFETELGAIGMIICYDGDFPELSRLLAVKGAEIIVRASALQRSFDIWYITNAARAYDNHVYVLASNLVGPDAQGNYGFGHSMIVNPIAWRLAQARGTEEIIAAKLDPDPMRYITYGSKSLQTFDHLEDRNLELYEEILKEARSKFEPGKRFPRIS